MATQRDEAIVEGHKQAERAERFRRALVRVRAIASDALAADDAAPGYADAYMLRADMADILAEIKKAGL